MITFRYVARDAVSGKKVSAEVQAESEKAAAKLIKDQGLTPLEIKQANAGSQLLGGVRHRIKAKDRVLFSRQMATLINAGLPLVQSLRTVNSQTQNPNLRAVIEKVIGDVEGGQSFAEALGKHPKVFNNVYVSLIAAGEASGTLDDGLLRIANQQEKDAEIMAKIRGAMVYPVIVIIVMLGVLLFILTTVLPQVEELYRGLPGAKLPFVTRALLAASDFVTGYWWLLIGLIGTGAFFTTRWARTGPGKELVDKLKMKGKPLGTLFMKLYMARFSRTGATLVASGVPLLQVLSITAAAVNNVHVARSINKAAEKVKGGKALSDSLEGDPNFLELVPNMIRIGEQSGNLENMLAKTADYYEKEVDEEIKTISTIIEPVLMIIMGISAFIIVAAVLLPIYGLVGKNIIR